MVSLPFSITPDYEIKVKKDDTVTVGQVLATIPPAGTEKISVAQALSVSPHDAGKYLKIQPGDMVESGNVLAIKKGLFKEVKMISEVSGTVVAFERDTGLLQIRTGEDRSSQRLDIKSPIAGLVTVCNNSQIVIQTDRDVLLGIRGSGSTAESTLLLITPISEGTETGYLYALETSIIGHVILAEVTDRDVLLKAIGMGVDGIITKNASDTDISYLIERNISTPVIVVDSDAWKKIIKWTDKKVYLDGMAKTILLLHTSK